MEKINVPAIFHPDHAPSYGTASAAGMDLRAAIAESVALEPGKRLLIPTGVKLALPQGYEAQVRPRSGLALKHGITVLNSPGTIDADYRGEIGVILYHAGEETYWIQPGERIAQMVVAQYITIHLEPVEVLPETDRGQGGFGHTGK
jgi:dUTP pyrophosphatase